MIDVERHQVRLTVLRVDLEATSVRFREDQARHHTLSIVAEYLDGTTIEKDPQCDGTLNRRERSSLAAWEGPLEVCLA